MADPLITLEQLKVASGEFGNPSDPSSHDAKLEAAIIASSALIRNYTDKKFELTQPGDVATDRRFEYSGGGVLDIDECQDVENVSSSAGYSGSIPRDLTVDEWGLYPLNDDVKMWMRLADTWYGGISPEMGFTYNLDTLFWRIPVKPNVITVTALWGWPEIPYDVQQAATWTALSIYDTSKPYSQESIADYSRTRGADAGYEAIPDRAQVALAPYLIPNV